MEKKSDVTRLLKRLREGEKGIYDKIYPVVYDELRQLAYTHMHRQLGNHTLSRTELVHETYLKMIDQTVLNVADRCHFLAIASRCMRQILIDYARKKNAKKRGGKQKDLTYIDELFRERNQKAQELININYALERLEKLNKRMGKIIEMRFFGEMTIKETAKELDISESTVKRDWLKARGWLFQELKGRFELK